MLDEAKKAKRAQEVLAWAKKAEDAGLDYVAKIIRNSKNSSDAALRNLIVEALAKQAEEAQLDYTAKIIRNSQNSSIEALKNLLDEAKEAQMNAKRENLAKEAEEADLKYVAKIIRNSKHSSISALKYLLDQAKKGKSQQASQQATEEQRKELINEAKEFGINDDFVEQIGKAEAKSLPAWHAILKTKIQEKLVDEAQKAGLNDVAQKIAMATDQPVTKLKKMLDDALKLKQVQQLAKEAKDNGLSYTAKIIRNSKHSSPEALKNLLDEAKKEHQAQREPLAKEAEAAGLNYTAKIIRNSKTSSLEALRNLLDQAKKNKAQQDAQQATEEQRKEVINEAKEFGINGDFVEQINKAEAKNLPVLRTILNTKIREKLVTEAQDAGLIDVAQKISMAIDKPVTELKKMLDDALKLKQAQQLAK